MTDYCLTCLYEDYDGAEEPCINCVGVGGKRPSEYLQKKPPKPITNADRIRAMTDEELAKAICRLELLLAKQGHRGFQAWLDWLKEEAKPDD